MLTHEQNAGLLIGIYKCMEVLVTTLLLMCKNAHNNTSCSVLN